MIWHRINWIGQFGSLGRSCRRRHQFLSAKLLAHIDSCPRNNRPHSILTLSLIKLTMINLWFQIGVSIFGVAGWVAVGKVDEATSKLALTLRNNFYLINRLFLSICQNIRLKVLLWLCQSILNLTTNFGRLMLYLLTLKGVSFLLWMSMTMLCRSRYTATARIGADFNLTILSLSRMQTIVC